MSADQPTRDSLPAEHLHADEPTVDGSAREAEAGQDVAGTQDDPAGTRERDAAVPAADEVAPTTDAPDVAAAVEESGGEGLVD